MSRKTLWHYTVVGTILVAVLFSLFEVSLDPQFALPREVLRAEPAQERRYTDCLNQQDRVIHERAFSQIDNPDVQKEFHHDRAREGTPALPGATPGAP